MSEQERIRDLEAELAEARQHVKAALANGGRAIAKAKRLLEITERLAAENARLQAQVDQLTQRVKQAEEEAKDCRERLVDTLGKTADALAAMIQAREHIEQLRVLHKRSRSHLMWAIELFRLQRSRLQPGTDEWELRQRWEDEAHELLAIGKKLLGEDDGEAKLEGG